jgi:hypothetical protein
MSSYLRYEAGAQGQPVEQDHLVKLGVGLYVKKERKR